MPTDANIWPRRVPKLAVRNKTADDQVPNDTIPSPTKATSATTDTVRPSLSAHSSGRTVSPSLDRRISDKSQESVDAPTQQNTGRDGVSTDQAKDQKAKKKKKSSGMLGFLTLKEPSTSAWEEFAEAQKKITAEKSVKTPAVGKPGRPTQKLPDFVPKTNSKWDGLPEASKKKSVDTNGKDRSNRNSVVSASTKQTNRSGLSSVSDESIEQSTARRFGSLSSKPSRQHAPSLSLSRDVLSQSATLSDEPIGAGYRVPTPIAIHPALRNREVTPWDEPTEQDEEPRRKLDRLPRLIEPPKSPQTFLHPPSSESSPILARPEFDLPDATRLGGFQRLRTATSPIASPQVLTDIDDETIADVANQYHYLLLGNQSAIGGENGTFWHSDTDNEDSGVTAVVPVPAKKALNFSRPRGRPSPVEEYPVEPTIQEDDEGADMHQPTLQNEERFPSTPDIDPAASHIGRASTEWRSNSSTSLGRASSASSHLTSITTTTSTTVTRPSRSPTFSDMPSESTRPSTATSMTSTAANQRRTSLSPIRSNSDAASLASSVAPSVMSVQWTMSPKERLGLGGKMTRRSERDALPWEADELRRVGPQSDAAAKRQSGLSHVSQEGGKFKRLSMRLGRK
ncbi:hypothetical protein LTR08_008645 [Meristemomyces frigidus]|nr:hypothetical protein LTR08_008645 [Meristemomyces frigidus]